MQENDLLGRNINKEITVDGVKVIQKQLVGEEKDKKRRLSHLLNWERQEHQGVNSPRMVSVDEIKQIASYQFIDNNKTLLRLFEDGIKQSTVDDLIPIFEETAKSLALIHNSKINEEFLLNNPQKLLRPLIALNPKEYTESSGAELELFALLQQDSQLIEALGSYQTDQKYQKMIHGDVRLDQFLYDGDKVWVIDFEEYTCGDALADISGIIGAVLFEVYLEVFYSSWDGSRQGETDIDINNQLHNKETKLLELISPLVISFITRYQKISHEEIDGALLSSNIGCFFIERIISRSKFSFKLSAVDRALAGIGREFIVSPENFSALLSAIE
ncbi:phosphotransferase [Streptococcus devriesei]|uniref:phosphotransferase n=1 Tax=Streptococcus devriesei TaxID=231233 RepID=UPI0004124870|nr:phosphotransferase [Streptococcus devriesei]